MMIDLQMKIHSRQEDLSQFSTKLVTRFHELPPSVPRTYYRAVVSLNYCYLMCLLIHLLLIPTFFILGETFLGVFNIGSVAVFSWCLYLNAMRGNYRLPVIVGTLEIVLHATLCVITFGWDAGFHYYILALGVSTFIIPWWTVGRKLQVLGGIGLLLVILDIHTRWNQPLSSYSNDLLWALYLTNLLILIASLALIGFAVSLSAARAEENLNIEKRRSEKLLHNILPVAIAERLKSSDQVIADRFEKATILFSDIVGFTRMSETVSAEELVGMLNEIFTMFDRLVDDANLEKIKTIGDGYMVAGGIPIRRNDHAEAICELAIAMRDALEEFRRRSGIALNIRIGVHSGPVIAGVIGFRKFAYDVWGDTVNTASRMESHGIQDEIHVSAATYELVRHIYELEPRGTIEVKGKGTMSTYLLRGRRSIAVVP